jgi:endoglucanase
MNGFQSRFKIRRLGLIGLVSSLIMACNGSPAPVNSSDQKLNGQEILFARPLKTGFLSDQPWSFAGNGSGPAERDMSNGENAPADGRPLSLGGTVFKKGLGVHAASNIIFTLDAFNNCTTFSAVVGLDDEVRYQQYGSVKFQVWVDGAQVWESGLFKVKGTPLSQAVNLPINGKSTLELRVTDNGDGNGWDHGNWASARVECSAGAATAPGFSTTLPFSRGVNLAGADFGENRPLPGTYVTDYIYPNQSEVDYFNAKGMGIYRLPFLWERLQRTLYAKFDADEQARLDAFVNATTAKGKIVILDPHNYARYFGALIGSSAVPNAAFADFWRRLAEHFKGNKNVVFGVMNEPYSKQTPDNSGPAQPLPVAQWVSAANDAIAAIRSTGAGNTILVPGTRFSGAWTWFGKDSDGASNAEAMLEITDSGNNLVFEVHQYLDTYASGTEDLCLSATIGSERLKAFTGWLRDNNRKGFLGEFSSGQNALCDAALEDTVRYVETNKDVWRGWTYWAAGPYWKPGTSLEPQGNQDARQMPILQKFLTAAR